MGALKKAELPRWVTRLNEMAPNVSEAGLHGLLDHAQVLMPLGEVLARQLVSRDELQTVVDQLLVKARSRDTSRPVHRNVASDIGTEAFWEYVWEQILGRKIEIPRIPKIKAKTLKAIQKYGFKLVYLPAITESDYPERFLKLRRGTDFVDALDERIPLEGQWLCVETIEEHYETDLSKDKFFVDHSSKYSRTWYTSRALEDEFIPNVARTFGLTRMSIRLPTIEELNLIGNLFRWLNETCSMNLPELRQVCKRERCLNRSRGVYQMTLGGSGYYEGPEAKVIEGGIARLGVTDPFNSSSEITFRLVIVL